MAQTSLGLSGRFWPIRRPLFQAAFWSADTGVALYIDCLLDPDPHRSQRAPMRRQTNLPKCPVSALLRSMRSASACDERYRYQPFRLPRARRQLATLRSRSPGLAHSIRHVPQPDFGSARQKVGGVVIRHSSRKH